VEQKSRFWSNSSIPDSEGTDFIFLEVPTAKLNLERFLPFQENLDFIAFAGLSMLPS
jgi:hypothetical protein